MKNIKPTESELEILNILWEYGPCTVRFVNEQQNQKKEVGYTTTLKLLQIMTEKGIVERNEGNRTHVYTALLKQKEARRDLVDRFVNAAFRGSGMELVMQLLGNSSASPEELKQIKELIKKLEEKQ